MISWKNLKKDIRKLELEEKVIGIASLILLISCFLPWHAGLEIIGKDKYINFTGLQGSTFFIGYLIFLFTLTTVMVISSRIFKIQLPKLSVNYNFLLSILGAETVLLGMIAYTIYTNARFGIYFVLISATVTTVFSFLLYKRQEAINTMKQSKQIFENNYKEVMKPEPEISVKDEFQELPQVEEKKNYSNADTGRNIIHEALRRVGNGEQWEREKKKHGLHNINKY